MKLTSDLTLCTGHWVPPITRRISIRMLRLSRRVVSGVAVAVACIVATNGDRTVHATEAGAFSDAQGQTVALVARSDLSAGTGDAVGSDQAAMLRDAETAYHNARYDAAMAGFAMVAAMQNEPFAWLRIGNIWHRRGQSAMAMDAYTRAVQTGGASDLTMGIAQRASKNLVLLGLSLAELSAQRLDGRKTPGQWEREIQRRLARLESSIATRAGLRVREPSATVSGNDDRVTPGRPSVRATVGQPRISTVRLDGGS